MMASEKTCLAFEDVAAMAERRLAGAERVRVVAHLAECVDCRELLAEALALLDEVALGAAGEPGAGNAGPVSDGALHRHGPTAGATVGESGGKVLGRPAQGWSRRRSTAALGSLAAALTLVSAVVAYRSLVPPQPPSRTEWLASMPPAQQLVPALWEGVVMRGGGGSDAPTQQSAELGALLVDLEVALAAGSSVQAAERARRMAAIMADAGLLDAEVAELRQAARDDGEVTARLAEVLPRVEPSLRMRFQPFYLDLGTFLEQARLASAGDRVSFLTRRDTRRYLRFLLAQRDHELPAETRSSLRLLQSSSDDSGARLQAATAGLEALTR